VEVVKKDEMKCLITGLNFLLKQVSAEVFTYEEGAPLRYEDVKTQNQIFPYMIVNIGSGVSIIKVFLFPSFFFPFFFLLTYLLTSSFFLPSLWVFSIFSIFSLNPLDSTHFPVGDWR